MVDGEKRPRAAPGWGKAQVLSVGHSTRPLEELMALLAAARVTILADIRTVPRSLHNPQFNTERLGAALAPAGIRYVHLPRLGGLRRARRDSPNGAWHNASFRGYADYMLTPDFEEGLMQLRALAQEGRVAVMCAEAVPWRCHRSLLADALFAHGVVVQHIMGMGRGSRGGGAGKGALRPHQLTPFAKLEGRKVTYPAPEEQPLADAPR
jgi:uncharacterized protein (DUF488 family)